MGHDRLFTQGFTLQTHRETEEAGRNKLKTLHLLSLPFRLLANALTRNDLRSLCLGSNLQLNRGNFFPDMPHTLSV